MDSQQSANIRAEAARRIKATRNVRECKAAASDGYIRAAAEIAKLRTRLDELLVQAERNDQNSKADWTIAGSLLHYAEHLEELELSE